MEIAALHTAAIGPGCVTAWVLTHRRHRPGNTAAIKGISCRSPSLGQDFLLPEADRPCPAVIIMRAHDPEPTSRCIGGE